MARRARVTRRVAASGSPRPPTLFVGRERERAQLERGLAQVPVAVICGLAGVGKSSLAYAIAAGRPTVHAAVRGGEPGAIMDELRRALGPAPEVLGDDARAAALAAALDEREAVAVIDDLHVLGADDQARLLAMIGARLTRGRLIATSRERPASAQGYDRVEVHLGGLTERAARALWAALDALRGPTAGFARAFAASGGNPFLLRRSHAGDPSGPDPLVAAIAALPADAARCLGAIALAATPLGPDELAAIAGRDPRAALAILRRALLIDLDGDGAPLSHELVRAATRAALGAERARELHGELAAAFAARRDAAGIHAAVRHWIDAGQPERARTHLRATGRALLDLGASRTVAALAAELGPDRELAALRARALVRLLDVAEGERMLRSALAARPPSGAELSALGTLALCAGRFDDAGAALARAALDDDASPAVKAAIAGLDAMRRFHTEALAPAMADLARAAASARGNGRAVLAATATYLSWLERYAIGAERSGTPTSDNRAPSAHGYRAAALGALALGGYDIRAAPGDSARALAALEAALASHDDPLARIHADAVGALRRWEDGDRLGASAALTDLAGRADDAGYVLAVLWIQVFAARIAFVLGRRRHARALLERVAHDARALGATALVRAAGYGADDDPVARLAVLLHSPGAAPSSSVRTRAFQALAAVCRGDAAPSLVPDPRPGYHVEAALTHLAQGVVGRRQGGARGKTAWSRATAAAAAALAAADDDLLPALCAVIDGDPRGPAAPVVLDSVRHEIIAGGETIALGKRPVMRKLLYALAARVGEVLTKDELTQAAWGQAYDPLRHDNPLFVNLSRLRSLVKAAGVSVEADPDQGGYRLVSRDPILLRRGR